MIYTLAISIILFSVFGTLSLCLYSAVEEIYHLLTKKTDTGSHLNKIE